MDWVQVRKVVHLITSHVGGEEFKIGTPGNIAMLFKHPLNMVKIYDEKVK